MDKKFIAGYSSIKSVWTMTTIHTTMKTQHRSEQHVWKRSKKCPKSAYSRLLLSQQDVKLCCEISDAITLAPRLRERATLFHLHYGVVYTWIWLMWSHAYQIMKFPLTILLSYIINILSIYSVGYPLNDSVCMMAFLKELLTTSDWLTRYGLNPASKVAWGKYSL